MLKKILLFTLLISTSFVQAKTKEKTVPKNVLGQELTSAGSSHKTGFYRDGFCNTGPDDQGIHVVAATMTKEFLEYSKSKGNDLMTPIGNGSFPGLKPGDNWCLCAARWKEAYDAGVAPKVILEATHEKALEFTTLHELKQGK